MIERKQYDFDAIVVGSGISGGWAAKELTEKGLKVLVLERGKPLAAGTGYLGEHAPNWKLPYQGKRPRRALRGGVPGAEQGLDSLSVRRTGSSGTTTSKIPMPWMKVNRFCGHGRTWSAVAHCIWGRQTYRWSEQDFKANETDGHGIPWPVGYKDIAPWYSYVEKFVGINGKKEGLPQLPDSEFQKPMPWFAAGGDHPRPLEEKGAGRHPDQWPRRYPDRGSSRDAAPATTAGPATAAARPAATSVHKAPRCRPPRPPAT